MLKKITAGLVLAGVFAFAVPSSASANHLRKCWGVVSSQLAQVEGGLGEHSSSQTSPRMGLGNVARAFGFSYIGQLGQFLASIDPYEETSCP